MCIRDRLLAEYDSAVDDALMAAQMGEEALDSYERAIDSLINLQRALESLGVEGDAGDVRIDGQAVKSLLHLTEQALGAIESLQAVSYTHLDVYKRQELVLEGSVFIEDEGDKSIRCDRATLYTCLLYTSAPARWLWMRKAYSGTTLRMRSETESGPR